MKINVIDDKGIEKNANIITSFKLNRKNYIIYTFNEEDDTNSVRIYISELRIKMNRFSFNNIINNEEWDLIKEIMKEMAKGIDNIDFLLENYDVEIIDMGEILSKNDYSLATIKDSKIVKVSLKFINGLYNTYKELFNRLSFEEPKAPTVNNDNSDKVKLPTVVDVDRLPSSPNTEEDNDPTAQKMKDIWEYSSMLQKKIARDMESLNSKVVKLDGERYYVKVKDPLYLREKLDIKGNIFDKPKKEPEPTPIPMPEINNESLLKELEPTNVLDSNIGIGNDQSLFYQLEKELSGINDNFNKIVVDNQKKKVKLASEIEKRLQDVASKEKELMELEQKLNKKASELEKKEEELMLANARLNENVKALTKYAGMVNSVILKRSEDE